jgi:peptidylprolyl isomerase
VRTVAALLCLFALLPAAVQEAEAAGPIPADGAAPVTLPSGLVYSVLTPGGAGKSPKHGDTVNVHYTGWLTDDKVFDSSRDRGTPATFPVGGLIAAWNATLMTPGARWKLTVPLGWATARPAALRHPGQRDLIRRRADQRGAHARHAGDPSKQTTTASGLVYEVLKVGEGPRATLTDVVEVDVALWNPKGKLLHSAGYGSDPVRTLVDKLALPCLKEAIQLLQAGGRLWMTAPATLAFGAQSPSPDLPANSPTIWEVGLIAIVKPLVCPPFAKSAPGAARKLPSGLEIEVLKDGTGRSPKIGEPVTVHYTGWLTDGTLFDSSFSTGAPATFQLGRVIQGWNEGLQLMKEGGQARLTIPGALAYGPSGNPQAGIAPNTTLIFYVELIKVGK